MSKNADGTDRAPRKPKSLEAYVLSVRLPFAIVARLAKVASGTDKPESLFGERPARPVRPADTEKDSKVWAQYALDVETFFERDNAFLANNAAQTLIATASTDAMTEATESHAESLKAYDAAMKVAATDPSRREESPAEESPAK